MKMKNNKIGTWMTQKGFRGHVILTKCLARDIVAALRRSRPDYGFRACHHSTHASIQFALPHWWAPQKIFILTDGIARLLSPFRPGRRPICTQIALKQSAPDGLETQPAAAALSPNIVAVAMRIERWRRRRRCISKYFLPVQRQERTTDDV